MLEATVMLVIFGIEDSKKKKLGTKKLYFAFALAFVLACIRGSLFPEGIAGMLLGAVLLLVSRLTRGQIGNGDAFILMITGLFLGIRKNMELFFLGLLLASAYAGYLIIIKHYKRKYMIAFVPFLAAAQVLLFLLELF